jgi:predicted transcriptional regulator
MRGTIPKSAWAEIRTAYASGIGLREIARNMGIPEETVLSHAKREGWTGKIQRRRSRQ